MARLGILCHIAHHDPISPRSDIIVDDMKVEIVSNTCTASYYELRVCAPRNPIFYLSLRFVVAPTRLGLNYYRLIHVATFTRSTAQHTINLT